MWFVKFEVKVGEKLCLVYVECDLSCSEKLLVLLIDVMVLFFV